MTGTVGFSLGSGFGLALRLCLGVTFAYSSTSKLRDPRCFADAVITYEIAPQRIARMLGFGVLPAELLLAIAFLGGWLLVPASLIALGMIAIFAGAVVVNLRRGRRIPCGCFGDRGETISIRTVARLAFLMVGALAVLAIDVSGSHQWSVDLLVREPGGAGQYLLEIVPLGLLLALASAWVFHVPELRAVVPLPRFSLRRDDV